MYTLNVTIVYAPVSIKKKDTCVLYLFHRDCLKRYLLCPYCKLIRGFKTRCREQSSSSHRSLVSLFDVIDNNISQSVNLLIRNHLLMYLTLPKVPTEPSGIYNKKQADRIFYYLPYVRVSVHVIRKW